MFAELSIIINIHEIQPEICYNFWLYYIPDNCDEKGDKDIYTVNYMNKYR